MPPRGRTSSSTIRIPRSDGSMLRVARLYGGGPEKDDLATFSFQTPSQSGTGCARTSVGKSKVTSVNATTRTTRRLRPYRAGVEVTSL
jgi:hypothetical protein